LSEWRGRQVAGDGNGVDVVLNRRVELRVRPVHKSIERTRGGIAAICRRYGVRRLEVFGSAARGVDFDPELSDVDFLVQFDHGDRDEPLEQFFGLSESLQSLLGRPVDLVELDAVTNPFILAGIDRSRELVFPA
jgi:predicted nucleotidyltransferase